MRPRLALLTLVLLAGCSGTTRATGGTPDAPLTSNASSTDLNAASTLATSAAKGVTASPQPGDHYALPDTQISFRHTTAAAMATLAVRGSSSGVHTGQLKAHSDAQGVSWVPDKAFSPGEQVTVSSPVTVAGATSGRFSFTVSKPVSGTKRVLQIAPKAADKDVQHFVSRPDLLPPKLTIKHAASGVDPGYLFLAPTQQGQLGSLIADNTGSPVWMMPSSMVVNDFSEQTYLGQPVLTWGQGQIVNGHGEGSYVIADQHYATIATIACAGGCLGDHHELQITKQGTALFTSYPIVRVGGQAVVDGMAQEIDIKTGLVEWEWHSLDHVPVSQSYAPAVKAGQPPLDYFHINSLEPDGSGKILISGRATHAFYEVSTATGDVLWTVGGKQPSFTMKTGTTFSSQHDVRRHGDGTVTLFDNGAGVGSGNEKQTRGLRLKVDTSHHTVTLLKAYTSPTKRLATSQGNVQVLAKGHVLMGYGQAQAITEYDSAGHVLFDATLPGHTQSYRTFRFTWTGQPTTRPDAVVSGSALFTSWNGATLVARWQLVGGPDADHLSAVGAPVTRKGFETQLPLGGATGVVAAQALAADGTVLATSAAVPA